jgi:hypothetical protein
VRTWHALGTHWARARLTRYGHGRAGHGMGLGTAWANWARHGRAGHGRAGHGHGTGHEHEQIGHGWAGHDRIVSERHGYPLVFQRQNVVVMVFLHILKLKIKKYFLL